MGVSARTAVRHLLLSAFMRIAIIRETGILIATNPYWFSNRDRNKGVGIGLAIVKRLATLLNHPLYMHSIAGKGSSFTIQVPLTVNAREEIHTAQSRAIRFVMMTTTFLIAACGYKNRHESRHCCRLSTSCWDLRFHQTGNEAGKGGRMQESCQIPG